MILPQTPPTVTPPAALAAAQNAPVASDTDDSPPRHWLKNYHAGHADWWEPENPLPEQVLAEFRLSAIPDRLTRLNVEWVEGDEAILLLAGEAMAQSQKVTSYVTVAAAKWRDKYKFAAAGGWATTGCKLDGSTADNYYFKPDKPRQQRKGFGKQKTKILKYETPAKCPAEPILPWVDPETAQKIYRKYDLKPLPGESFWQTIQRSSGIAPIAITEGFKKALSLIAQGIPAIAIRGIYSWRVPETNDLHPIIAQFAGKKRKFYIIFDQDEKLKTQSDVRKQAMKLGQAFCDSQCQPHYLIWDGALGKGIDDVLYAQGETSQIWLEDALSQAWDMEKYQRESRIFTGLSRIKQLSTSKFEAEKTTKGDYMPPLPSLETGAIHAIRASMNSGKTSRIGQDWVEAAREKDWLTLILAPTNALGKKVAHELNLPHIHDYNKSKEQQQILLAAISHCKGIVLCPDSIHRLPPWFLDQPLLLVLDEGNQVINHLVEGNTLKSRWSEILEKFGKIAQHAAQTGAIILSEDGLPDRAINFVKHVSGATKTRVFQHVKENSTWHCTAMTGQVSDFRANFLAAAQPGNPLLFVTTSQQECRRMEIALKQTKPELKVTRIDSKTNQKGQFNQFFINPDQWISDNQPDVLVLSPSAKSGISIEKDHFKSVWGYFPALETDSQMQMLGRYRPPVPRFLFAPPFIQRNGDESLYYQKAIADRLEKNAAALGGAYSVSRLEEEVESQQRTIENAAMEYLAASRAVSGTQKSIAYAALVARLEDAGHTVTQVKLGHNKEMSQLWNQVTDQIWRDDARAGASAVVNPEIHTIEWALSLSNSLEASQEDRLIASKVLLRHEFPGIDFDDFDDWHEGICKNYGLLRRGVTLQAKAENLVGAKEADRAGVEKILGANIRAFHRLPRKYVQAALIKKTGVMGLLDGMPYSNSDARAIEVKEAALKFAKEIAYWLGLTIQPEQTPVKICNRLLKRLGITTDQIKISRPGRRGEQLQRVYRVEIDPDGDGVRQKFLEAARRKVSVSESVSAIPNNLKQSNIEMTDTRTKPPPDVGKNPGQGENSNQKIIPPPPA